MYTRVYSNHREPIYISLFPCKSRTENNDEGSVDPEIQRRKYRAASRNVSTREEEARRGAKISRNSTHERASRRKKREFSKLILSRRSGSCLWIRYLVTRRCSLCYEVSRNAKSFASNGDISLFQYSRGSVFFEIKLYRV